MYIVYLDDDHAGDVLFLRGLGQALARIQGQEEFVLVHGGGLHAENNLESNGYFRQRVDGVLAVKSAVEAQLVERATRRLNQKIVGILTDAAVASVGIMGTQRGTLVVREGHVEAAAGSWLRETLRQGVVIVVSAHARDAEAGSTGAVPVPEAVIALARGFIGMPVEVVIFTRTNLPGIMRGGSPVETVNIEDSALRQVLPDLPGARSVAEAGLSILITNTMRFADARGPVGSRIPPVI